MIIVNGYAFQTEGLAERPSLEQFSAQKRGLTGYVTTIQSQFVGNERTHTLLVDAYERRTLENQLAHLGKFDFVDEAAFSWLLNLGTDDAYHAYNTGAWFKGGTVLNFVPQQANGALACDQRWQVDVTIVPQSRGVRSIDPVASLVSYDQTPGGTINGSNPTFTLTVVPTVLFLFTNRVMQVPSTDYNLSGSTITFIAGSIPQTGDTLFARILV